MNNNDILNILNDNILNNFLFKEDRSYSYDINQKIYMELNKKYGNIFRSCNEIAYLIKNKNNLQNLHIFCQCGNKNRFANYYKGYKLFCSNICIYCRKHKGIKISNTKQNFTEEQKILAKKHYEESMMKNHGCKHNWASKDPKLNGRTTKKERYGDENYSNPKKASKTKLIKYGTEKYNNSQKAKITRLNTIDENGKNLNQMINEKMVKKRKADVDQNGMNSFQRAALKAVQTAINNIDENGLNSYQRGSIKSKITSSIKYGVDHHTKTQEYRNIFKDKEFVKNRGQKDYETKKKNKSFNRRSKQEIRCYELLKTKFPDAEHSYRDEKRYPFNCDMYIPSKDLFIECHFGFAHGGEPFNSNNQKHLEEVERCNVKKEELRFDGKKKNSYAEKIKVWTISDPLKLKTFINNKLNFKIFYTEKEFENWFNNLN